MAGRRAREEDGAKASRLIFFGGEGCFGSGDWGFGLSAVDLASHVFWRV